MLHAATTTFAVNIVIMATESVLVLDMGRVYLNISAIQMSTGCAAAVLR